MPPPGASHRRDVLVGRFDHVECPGVTTPTSTTAWHVLSVQGPCMGFLEQNMVMDSNASYLTNLSGDGQLYGAEKLKR